MDARIPAVIRKIIDDDGLIIDNKEKIYGCDLEEDVPIYFENVEYILTTNFPKQMLTPNR